jgi:hypothetical protein
LSHQHRPPEELTSLLEGELAVCAGGHGVRLIRLERICPADLDDLLRRPVTEIATHKPFAITTNFDPTVAGPNDTIHRRYPAPARVNAELPACPGDLALDAEALGELALLDQVAGRQEEIGVAIVECQQAVRSRSHSSSSREAKTFQQMLLAADRKNDCDRRQRK